MPYGVPYAKATTSTCWSTGNWSDWEIRWMADNAPITISAGPFSGQTIDAAPEELAALGIDPGSPRHQLLAAMLKIAFHKGRSEACAEHAKRMKDIITGGT
jgi:hypothetical protein